MKPLGPCPLLLKKTQSLEWIACAVACETKSAKMATLMLVQAFIVVCNLMLVASAPPPRLKPFVTL